MPISILPFIFLGILIIVLILLVGYIIRLRRDIDKIRKLLEERQQ